MPVNVIHQRILDSDFIFDYLELDSDADGCFDVVEAGFTDGDSDGFLDPSPVTVGIDGTVTSGSDGYDSPNTNTSFQFYNYEFFFNNRFYSL